MMKGKVIKIWKIVINTENSYYNMDRRKKRGVVWQGEIVWWVIAIIVLVVSILFILVLREKGTGALEYFKNLWRFR
jgi:heme/copper-type cytochrome/quinol oxidase subunit 2